MELVRTTRSALPPTEAPIRLPEVHLAVDVVEHDGGRLLVVRSDVDPRLGLRLLVPTGGTPYGISRATRLGALHELPWSLVYGATDPPDSVELSTGDLRYRQETQTVPVPVGGCWVAAVAGRFRYATCCHEGRPDVTLVLA